MEFIGLEELDRKLAALSRAASGRQLRAGVRAGGNVVKERAQQLIPVGSMRHRTYKGRTVNPGFAKKSVRVVVSVDRSGQQATALIGVRNEAFYAVQFVEVGTQYQPAQPWLRPAHQSTETQQISALATVARNDINRVARGR